MRTRSHWILVLSVILFTASGCLKRGGAGPVPAPPVTSAYGRCEPDELTNAEIVATKTVTLKYVDATHEGFQENGDYVSCIRVTMEQTGENHLQLQAQSAFLNERIKPTVESHQEEDGNVFRTRTRVANQGDGRRSKIVKRKFDACSYWYCGRLREIK